MALLGQRRVVHDQERTLTAHELLRVLSQDLFEGLGRPAGGRHEVVHLLVIAGRYPCREGLDALALAGPNQPTQVHRGPALAGFVSKDGQEWPQPTPELMLL